jgi:hypothetical protein
VGLARLLSGVTNRARMECHLGCWVDNALRRWSGSSPGYLDLSRVVVHADGPYAPASASQRMLLSEIFVPDEGSQPGVLLHRARALAALELDIPGLHSELERQPPGEGPVAPVEQTQGRCFSCPFCAEFEEDGLSTFASLMGQRLGSRVVYEDELFVVMPPLGEFMEGGLLLLSRAHILSFAHLPEAHFAQLERLLGVICQLLSEKWAVRPLVFEHGPARERSKGVCCVDHAHLNIFPAQVTIHPHLANRMHRSVRSLAELQELRGADCGYLFVQENNGERRVYDGANVPTQLVRRIITTGLGMPERWHWRDYLGQNELIATFEALKGQIRV